MTTSLFDRITRKVEQQERLTEAEGLYLLTQADLMGIGRLANAVRQRLHPEGRVTFVVDSNPNYFKLTN